MTLTHSQLWDALVASALLGTERRPFEPPPATDGVGALLARLTAADPEKVLLSGAAILALHRRAGRLPVEAKSPPPAPSEVDPAPECTSQAGQHLTLMLNDLYADLLPEWLESIAKLELRVPAEQLPALLELGASKAELRPAIAKVIGKRGQWLAEQNEPWAFVTSSAADAELWQTGIKTQRVALLSQLRQRDPAQALTLVELTWAQEVAPDRWAFLQTLRLDLSLADEPFLEAALDDRAKDVRAAAAELLRQLPESRLCGRMTERVAGLIKWRKGKKPGFSVSLPDECDKDMERDGVQGKATRGAQVIGEKSNWLSQMAAAVPLTAWEQWCGGASPTEIVAAAARSRDWAALLLDALSKAAARDGDLKWVEALLSEGKVSAPLNLFNALPPDKKEQFVLKLLKDKPSVKHGEPATVFIFACSHAWSKKFSQAILDALYQDLGSDQVKYSYQLTALMDRLAGRVTPSLIPAMVKRLPEIIKSKSGMMKEVEKFLGKAQFRLEMLQAIRSD